MSLSPTKKIRLLCSAAGRIVLLLVGSAAASPENTVTNHWSFKPLVRPRIPPASNSNWVVRNPIDHFVLDKLSKNKLTPSPEADRRTLIRRLSFDLLGLPPAPEEVQAFENDRSDHAYEKLVDRFLNSPHFGECWARHWLDVVRFAETHGFEMNNPRPNAWHYRDYVIRSFNEDKPYDRFVLDQFAGDILGVDEATGFLVGGPWDMVKSPDIVLTSTQRADELHDMVSTTGSAFLGLTIGCARCHDHKFDPVPQGDYYAIKACLAGVQHGERKLRAADQATREREAQRCRQDLAQIESQLIEFEPLATSTLSPGRPAQQLRPPVNARRNTERFNPIKASRLRFTIAQTTDAEPCLDELEVYSTDPTPNNVALASNGTKARASSVYPNSEIHRIEHINDGKTGNSRSWISNERGGGWVELDFPREVTLNYVVWSRDREEKYSDRLALDYKIEVATEGSDWQVIASSMDRHPYSPNKTSEGISNKTEPQRTARHMELLSKSSKLHARLTELNDTPLVYAGIFSADPSPTHRLNRGDPMQEREEVRPGAVAFIPVSFTCDSEKVQNNLVSPALGSLTRDQQNRLALAHWLTAPGNPLPARVIVNRLWLYHFGEGFVSTPSDLGVNGARPTHPELLDWLAAELLAPTLTNGTNPPTPWSLKHIHRLMVTSATYRQASAPRAECLSQDAGTRLLWRFPPRRLDAEALRDDILATTGHLDLRIGGAGFSAFEPNDNYVRVYTPKEQFGPAEWRRMVYMTKVRMQQDSTFGAFDCPDGGQIAPKRLRSTTPLQALNLLNSGFTMQQAELFAERLQKERPDNLTNQIQRAFQLAFSRSASPQETTASLKLAQGHGLVVFCRALFNSNEFVFLE